MPITQSFSGFSLEDLQDATVESALRAVIADKLGVQVKDTKITTTRVVGRLRALESGVSLDISVTISVGSPPLSAADITTALASSDFTDLLRTEILFALPENSPILSRISLLNVAIPTIAEAAVSTSSGNAFKDETLSTRNRAITVVFSIAGFFLILGAGATYRYHLIKRDNERRGAFRWRGGKCREYPAE